MRPIDLISTDELAAELTERCKPAIFIGTKREGNREDVDFYSLNGNMEVCYGLCHQLALKIQKHEIKKIVESENA